MIVSNKWMRSNYGKALRNFLSHNATIMEIIDFNELPVFGDVIAYPLILITRKLPAEGQRFIYAPIQRLEFPSLGEEVRAVGTELDERSIRRESWTLGSDRETAILDKLRRLGVPLGEYVGGKIFFGIKTGLNEAFVIDGSVAGNLIASDPKSADLSNPS